MLELKFRVLGLCPSHFGKLLFHTSIFMYRVAVCLIIKSFYTKKFQLDAYIAKEKKVNFTISKL